MPVVFIKFASLLNTKVTLEFSHVGYKSLTKDFFAKKRNIIRFSPVLILKNEVLEEVVIKNETKNAQGVIALKAQGY